MRRTRPERRFGQRPIRPVRRAPMPGPWGSIHPYALRMLRYDHKTIRDTLNRLIKSKNANDRGRLLQRLDAEVAVHGRLKRIFYEAYRGGVKHDKDLLFLHRATEEEEAIDHMLDDLRDCEPASPRFIGRAAALRAVLRSHMRFEDDHFFRRARRLLGRDAMKVIGRRMQDKRKELVSAPAVPT